MDYNLNVFEYIKKALFVELSKLKFLDNLKAFLKPSQELNDTFCLFVEKSRRKASFTGQVIYLEHLLNDEFDVGQRRIYIADGQANVLPPFIFKKIEQRPIYLYNKSENEPKFYLYNTNEYFISSDFIVFVPSGILTAALELKIERLVGYYKQAGKRFEIQGF